MCKAMEPDNKRLWIPKVVSKQIIVPVSFEELKKNCIDECGGQNV